MKHTNFYAKLEKIRNQEIQELKIAVQANNRLVEWKNGDGPIIALSGTNMVESPFDVRVSRVSVSDEGILEILGHNNEDWNFKDEDYEVEDYEVDLYDIVTGQIAYIIDEIPETESVKDVTIQGEDFVITSICRGDLECRGFDVSNVSDGMMTKLANKMSDDYLEQLYWESMIIIAEYMGIPYKEGKEDEE